MSVLVVGLSHRSSPVALLERAALEDESRRTLLAELVAADSIDEAIVVATCNRLEVYAATGLGIDSADGVNGAGDSAGAGVGVGSGSESAVSAITELLAWRTGVGLAELSEHLYVRQGDLAVQHLFSVACGLDSMVVGEGQILGQVRDAVKEGRSVGTVGRVLGDVGERALRVGKRAHTETHLDRAGADMVSTGLRLATASLESSAASAGAVSGSGCPAPPHVRGDTAPESTSMADMADTAQLAGWRVLVLGAGSMSALAANTAAREGASTLIIANRTFGRADRVAECLTEAYAHIESRAVPLERVAAELSEVDLVISCTGAQEVVLGYPEVAAAAGGRTGRPLVLLDLALPHDVDARVRQLPGVHLVNLEDLQRASQERRGTEQRGDSEAGSVPDPDSGGAAAATNPLTGLEVDPVVPGVQAIVAEEVAEYRSVRRAELVTPTVVALRERAADVVQAEVERLRGRLPELDDDARSEVAYALRRVADKLLHQPTVRVKQLASAPDGDSYEFALRELFDLPAGGQGQG
ncbi:glutamyl-tRNA reductase [Lipingzhangella sp. LS1_29]|uniref:Glutamyl-tRNA reductase n=1 Tax=Lipingzhangella rawalii TaxID=2055835 RepID=A0ABU2H9B3_9ACTN|nr:glutamyl-tRNA reductase [Lipingzhangella rawalii]MDS1271901.1 glutamyl-tRNA reductase [Lipingzhangella rawalii]